MIKNESVNKLESLKTITNVLLAITLIGFFIAGVITLVNASSDSKATSVILFIVELIAIIVAWAIVNLAFDHFICRRQENIDYMNARLQHLNNKATAKNDKKEAK